MGTSLPDKLSHCWHPVAYSEEVSAGSPFATRLLEEMLVVWRTADGSPHAMKDLCIHRGTALSLGHIVDDCIVCPYHGWRYDAGGACTLIPQTASTNIPVKARVSSFRCQERYGLIWVAMAEPAYSLPEIPALEDDTWQVIHTGPYAWECDASRQVENFTDFGHFPWVHPGLLGDVDRPVVPDHSVVVKDHVLHYTVVRPEATNTEEFPIFANEETGVPERWSNYELHCPYTIYLRLGWGGEKGMVYLFVSQPVTRDACRGYCIVARNFDCDEPETLIRQFEDTIFSQDKRVVLSQRPEMVPFDLADELYLKFDAVAVNYRRTMQREDLAYYPTGHIEKRLETDPGGLLAVLSVARHFATNRTASGAPPPKPGPTSTRPLPQRSKEFGLATLPAVARCGLIGMSGGIGGERGLRPAARQQRLDLLRRG